MLSATLRAESRVMLAALVHVDGDGYNTAAEFRPTELLASAELILGEDSESSDEYVVFERDHESRYGRMTRGVGINP